MYFNKKLSFRFLIYFTYDLIRCNIIISTYRMVMVVGVHVGHHFLLESPNFMDCLVHNLCIFLFDASSIWFDKKKQLKKS